MADDDLEPGLYEALLTQRLEVRVQALKEAFTPRVRALSPGDASDRLSRFLAEVVGRAIDGLPDQERSQRGAELIHAVLRSARDVFPELFEADVDVLVDPPRVLEAILRRNPDGSAREVPLPLTSLLDTTILTNAPGEPAVGHELKAEIISADQIDVVMAFIRVSGIRPLLDAIHRHVADGGRVRVLTTTYTNSTELEALEMLQDAGVTVRVSYDTSATRLHAKAWLFERRSGFTTAYIGSSNLTRSAQITGIEWNIRVSAARNPDVCQKMAAVFESYWQSQEFVDFQREEFVEHTKVAVVRGADLLPMAITLRPFQEQLLEDIEVARARGSHRNLLVAATGTGKTVMAAVDFARLQKRLGRSRLLFVAHREEILAQSRSTFRHATGDASFGELWVGGKRPTDFDHVFASVQSLQRLNLDDLDPSYFDVVVVDEFHHAAAPSYARLLDHLDPVELLGLTATPERTDGLDVLRFFGGRIAAELRIWDAISQHFLVPFAYFAIPDGSDLTTIPWKRGLGYDLNELTNVYTANDIWVRGVIREVRRHVGNPGNIRALGFCVSVAHAEFMARKFSGAGIAAVAISGKTPQDDRQRALLDLKDGRTNVVFSVDLFNEGIDVPDVDTLLFLRPTDSALLFLQQLGRGLRRSPDKDVCTVLDFIGMQHRQFRFDTRYRALLGGSRRSIERQVENGFPFLPAGCSIELEGIAQETILKSIKTALPADWRSRCRELTALGDVTLAVFLDETGLDVEDLYNGKHSWTELRRSVGFDVDPPGPDETTLLRGIGRLLHVNDVDRLTNYVRFLESETAPNSADFSELDRRRLRMLLSALVFSKRAISLDAAIAKLWEHPQVRREAVELLGVVQSRVHHLNQPVGIADVPLVTHACYTRAEILAAFAVGSDARPPNWQTGVWWHEPTQTDLLAFTLDKSAGSFSPTTRYRDYAVSPQLIHWESQSVTSRTGKTGRRYLNHRTLGTQVLLFARLTTSDAFWCLGTAEHASDSGERPIAITWRLHQALPGDLYAQFAAAVA